MLHSMESQRVGRNRATEQQQEQASQVGELIGLTT